MAQKVCVWFKEQASGYQSKRLIIGLYIQLLERFEAMFGGGVCVFNVTGFLNLPAHK